MDFNPVQAIEDSQISHLRDTYREIERNITSLAVYGDGHGELLYTPVASVVIHHYEVAQINDLSADHIKEIWAFAKGLNEVGGLWMVFHSLRRLIQDWIAINDEAPVDLNEFWINKHEIMLQAES